MFPGTGDINEQGEGKGKGFSINFPLLPGTSNKIYLNLFRKTAPKILETYQPDVLITQLGVDTYFNDPLTQMGLSLKVYKDIAQTIKTCAREFCQNKWLAFGGGGYLMTVVPRSWSLFLAKMLDVELENELPRSWIEEAKDKAPNEDRAYLLWDRDDKTKVDLLANPEIAKEMINYTKSLIEVCNEKFIPALIKS